MSDESTFDAMFGGDVVLQPGESPAPEAIAEPLAPGGDDTQEVKSPDTSSENHRDEIKEGQSVPFDRFKEVNDQFVQLKPLIEQFGSIEKLQQFAQEQAKGQTLAQAQAAREVLEQEVEEEAAQFFDKDENPELFEAQKQLLTNARMATQAVLSQTFTTCETEFPNMDKGLISLLRPDNPTDLRSLAQYTHNRVEAASKAAAEKAVSEYIAKKAADSKAPTPPGRTGNAPPPAQMSDKDLDNMSWSELMRSQAARA